MKRLALSVLLLALCTLTAQADDYMYVVSKQSSFEEAKQDLIMAIENRGMKVNAINHIGEMLKRTASVLGDTHAIYDQAEQVEFCKAEISHAMMAADPANIVFCPNIISVYTLPGVPDKVYYAYRKPVVQNPSPAAVKAMAAVDALYAGIVSDAMEGAF